MTYSNKTRKSCSGKISNDLAKKYIGIYAMFVVIRVTVYLIRRAATGVIASLADPVEGSAFETLIRFAEKKALADGLEGEGAELFTKGITAFTKEFLKPPGFDSIKGIGQALKWMGNKGIEFGTEEGRAARAERTAAKALKKEAQKAAKKAAEKGVAEEVAEGEGRALAEAGDIEAGGGGPFDFITDVVALVVLIVQSALVIAELITLEFAAPDLMVHSFSDEATACVTIQQLDNQKDRCVNGVLNGDTCVPCNQLENMRDSEPHEQYISSYKNLKDITVENRNSSYSADAGKDPSVVHKLTSLTCGGDGILNPQNSGPTYADRPYPAGYCHRVKRVDDAGQAHSFHDKYNYYLTNDGNMCNETSFYSEPRTNSINETIITDVTKTKGPNPVAIPMKELIPQMESDTNSVTWNFMTLDWSKPESDTDDDLKAGCDGVLSCDWNNEGYLGTKYQSSTDTLGDWMDRSEDFVFNEDSDEKPIQPVDLEIIEGAPTNRPDIQNYNNSNVCNDDYEMAGDSIYFRKNNREFDLEVKNKEGQKFISNYCCPKIANGPQCPKWKEGLIVNYDTNKDEFKGHKDPFNEPNTKNCYLIDKPEFISSNIANESVNQDYNSNEDFTTIRSGSIQCGPKNETISMSAYGDTDQHKDNESIILNNLVQPIKRSDGKIYGTRFKLDSRYNYFAEYDSGATGYENYLDPNDYIPLREKTEDKNLSKYLSNNYFDYDIFNISNRNTTITDVIANELGHPNRKNLFCDNIECNDLEKTKYMQTVYDEFCKIDGSFVSSPSIPTKYNKFYRPSWINSDFKPENLNDPSELYSDICCEPINYARKTSFVGCDASGKNSYFIDNIIQNYNDEITPTIPNPSSNINRNPINPLPNKKQNLNQCIPSMEVKCSLSRDYYSRLPSPPNNNNLAQAIEDNKKCNNLLNLVVLNRNNVDSDNLEEYLKNKSLPEICESESDGMCSANLPHMSYNDSIYNKDEYWMLDRYSVGYAPQKGWLNPDKNPSSSWSETYKNSDYRINIPNTNVYTECNPINPCSNIYDLEIYNKQIDSLSIDDIDFTNNNGYQPNTQDNDNILRDSCQSNNNFHKIRYILNPNEREPPNKNDLLENHIKIKCRNFEDRSAQNFSNLPLSTDPYRDNSNPNIYYYNIGCISSPTLDDSNNEIINIY